MLPRTCDLLVLRRLGPADLTDFQAYRSDPQVGLFQGWTPLSKEEALTYLAEVESAPLLKPGHWTQIAIASTETDRLLGDLGLFVSEDQSQAEIGFTLAPRSQGRGLATSAVLAAIELLFERTSVQRIIAITDARNTPSIRLLERVGMSLISTAEIIFRGEPCTESTYALARR